MLQNGNYEAILGRVPAYIEYLEHYQEDTISATVIANALNYGEVQVRKDLARISFGGKPKIGYEVKSLLQDLKAFMGYHHETKAVIVGMGRLGEALYHYPGFHQHNIKIIAAFDVKEPYLDLDSFSKVCKDNSIEVGIITVNKENAQEVSDLMVQNNIKAIWNFAPVTLNVPKEIIVQNENMANSLSVLIKLMNDRW